MTDLVETDLHWGRGQTDETSIHVDSLNHSLADLNLAFGTLSPSEHGDNDESLAYSQQAQRHSSHIQNLVPIDWPNRTLYYFCVGTSLSPSTDTYYMCIECRSAMPVIPLSVMRSHSAHPYMIVSDSSPFLSDRCLTLLPQDIKVMEGSRVLSARPHDWALRVYSTGVRCPTWKVPHTVAISSVPWTKKRNVLTLIA